MRTAFIVSVGLACASVCCCFNSLAIGQQLTGMSSMSASESVLLEKPVAAPCPVYLHLRPSLAPNILEASKARHAGRTQHIEIDLMNNGTKDVTSFDAHVMGFSRHGQFQLLAEQYPAADEPALAASIHVDETVIAGGSRSLKRTVQNILGVKWLQLDTITFSDGSTWNRSSATACRVQPDPLLLVAQH